jgi:aminoglycoside phosphotransferase (APT) family kinase protein
MSTSPNADQLLFQPADLAKYPEVDALLGRLGLGPFVPGTLASPPGRNECWTGVTEHGSSVFVKKIHSHDAAERLRRMVFFAERAGRAGLATPEVLGQDEENGVLVFRYLEGARSLLDLFSSSEADDGAEEFDLEWCVRAGRLLAEVHALPSEGFDTSEHPLPPLPLMDAIPLWAYTRQSGAELHLWQLLHGDRHVAEALTELRRSDTPEQVRPWTPIHGDVRLDQFLVSGGELHLTDAEETRMGDPARDVGAFAGEWLFQAVNRIPLVLQRTQDVGQLPNHEEIVATGSAELDRLSPRTQAFFTAYLSRAGLDSEQEQALAVRAARYAGWHMLDRMISIARERNRLAPVPRAAAGIGRSLLFNPAQFPASLGLRTSTHAH